MLLDLSEPPKLSLPSIKVVDLRLRDVLELGVKSLNVSVLLVFQTELSAWHGLTLHQPLDANTVCTIIILKYFSCSKAIMATPNPMCPLCVCGVLAVLVLVSNNPN